MTPGIKNIIEDEIEKFSFQVPYDGTKEFYNSDKARGYGAAAMKWAEVATGFAEWMAIRGYKRSEWYHDKWYIPTNPQIIETNQPTTSELLYHYLTDILNKNPELINEKQL